MDSNYIPWLNKTSIAVGDVDTLIIRDAEPNSILYANDEQEVKSLQLGPGEIIVGTDGAPAVGALTGTPNQIIVNELKLSLPQDIATTSIPEFKDIKIDGDLLSDTFVTKNTVQTITAQKTFTAPIVTSSTVDGRDVSTDGKTLDTVAANYVTTADVYQTIQGTKQFMKGFFTSNIAPRTTGDFNVGDILNKYKDLYLSGNIYVDGSVDGRDIGYDGKKLDGIAADFSDVKANYVTTNTTQTITGTKTFDEGINFTTTGSSRRKISLYGTGTDHYFYGMAVDSNTTVIQCPSSAQDIRLKVGNSTESLTILEVRGDRGAVRPGVNNTTNLGSDTLRFKNLYINDDIFVGGLVDGRDIAADGKTLDALAGVSGYVTMDTDQDITGRKIFKNSYLILNSTVTGHAEIKADGAVDAGITMSSASRFTALVNSETETYLHSSVNDIDIKNNTDIIVRFKNNRSAILPGAINTTDLGSTALPFKHLLLGKGTGTIQMGHNIRGDGRAALALFSNGDQPSDIYFGQDARSDPNTNWSMGARQLSGGKIDFQFWRGPKNGGFTEFLTFKGDGTAIIPAANVNLGDEKNSFKNLYADAVLTPLIYFPAPTGLTTAGLSVCAKGTFTPNYNGTHGSDWWDGVGTEVKITVRYVRTSEQVTLTFDTMFETVSGGFIGSNWFNFVAGAIPAALRPATAQNQVIVIRGASAYNAGNVKISAAGKMDIYQGFSTGGWSAGLIAGFNGFSITYAHS